ncbi:MAG: aldo/keto reductase [Acidobacteria bacterium]|nr:aldo/keto reductase [Acidobacteriota bacterium]
MEVRTLGSTGLRVGRIGLGCTTFGREIDEPACFAIMDHAVANGITLFDTAEAYGGAEAKQYRKNYLGIDDEREVSAESHSSEKIIGRWLQSRACRDRIVLCTKVTTNHTPQHVAEAIDASLERLQTDYVDIYMFHSFDAETPVEERVAALDRVVRSGKVRHAGCSNYDAAQLRESLDASRHAGLRPIEVIEPNYNLLVRDIEPATLPLCRENSVGVMSYSPLGAGFLSGKYTPDRGAFPQRTRFHVIPGHADIYFSDRNFATVEKLHAFADRVGVPALQLAIGWVLQNPAVDTVLAGARSTTHLDNAIAAEALDFPGEWYTEMNSWG